MSDLRWVIAYDKQTKKRMDLACCPKGNTRFFAEKFRLQGYDAEIYTADEVDKIIEAESVGK